MHQSQGGSARGNARDKAQETGGLGQQRPSVGQRPQIGAAGAPSIRPIASKNMPQCFRENPNSRKRGSRAYASGLQESQNQSVAGGQPNQALG